MSNPVSVTTPAMQQVAAKFQDEAAQSRNDLQSVQTQRQQLGVSWTGEASQLFGRALDGWCAEYQVIIEQLNKMSEALHGNAKIFTSVEAQNAELARNPMGGGFDHIISPSN